MTACFVTHQGTLLCFGDDTEFCHVGLNDLDESRLVVADADFNALRAGLLAGQPVALRPRAATRSGLPRALGIGTARSECTLSLDWQDTHLCAGATGTNINFSDRVDAWEEFLPIAFDDVMLLRDFTRREWNAERSRGRARVELRPRFILQAGDFAVDLRRQATLGGESAVVSGWAAVLVDGWRIETLRRYEPLVVWRHDGSAEADEEIVLGLRSMAIHARYTGAVHVETRLERGEVRERCGLDDARLRVSRPPDGRCGLLPWDRGLDAGEFAKGPILLLANGVTCHRDLEPLLRAVVTTQHVALMPWVWTAEQTASDAHDLFAADPWEGPGGQACSGAVVGLPDLHRAATIHRLVSGIAAHRGAPAVPGDGYEDALLRYVIGRTGGAGTALLSEFTRTASSAIADRSSLPELAQPTLINHRPVPAAIRADAIRAVLGDAAG